MNDYVLADDLSGALEAGAAFGATDRRVILPLHGGAPDAPGALTVISTETRNAVPADAAAEVRRVLAEQRRRGACLRLKKIDSTLRGPVAAELEAMMAELGPPLVVFCPANPLTGRTMVGGRLLVHGVSLEETDFRHDPHWPARTGDIGKLLSQQGRVQSASVDLAALRANAAGVLNAARRDRGGPGVLVPDVETMDDLRLLVAAGGRMGSDVAWVGAGALANVLAGQSAARCETRVSPPVLVINGSRNPAAWRQVEAFKAEKNAEVLELVMGRPIAPQAERVAQACARRRIIALNFLIPEGTPDAAVRLQAWIADLVTHVMASTALGLFYLTGGETARRVCQSLGGECLEILGEIEPGVVLGQLEFSRRAPLHIVTKPGGYGEDQAMVRQLGKLMK
ncbi:MAG: four-carbon acid sugar kinase family protein [Opitutaceae bacterium]|nr:four-carbon acid sugar kinase family protein [Opitutaceae bacterium]